MDARLADPETRSLFDELAGHSEVHRFDDVAEVDVGIVTGANKYSLVTDETVNRYRFAQWAHPMFGRSEHCSGIIYDERQHVANAPRATRQIFYGSSETLIRSRRGCKGLHRLGETQRLHTRYKCRVRSPWYTVPSVYATEVGMLERPTTRHVSFSTDWAYTTDTAYRIRSEGDGRKWSDASSTRSRRLAPN